jgi:hypothetical protein
MSRTLGASLLVGTTALLAACSGPTPTSARNIDNQGPRRDLTCRSGYNISVGENGDPVCAECPDGACTDPNQT